jgi:hypothetical protein
MNMKHFEGEYAVEQANELYPIYRELNDTERIGRTNAQFGYSQGYSDCLDRTNAKGLLEALEQLLASYKLYVKNYEKSEFVINAETAIKKATT